MNSHTVVSMSHTRWSFWYSWIWSQQAAPPSQRIHILPSVLAYHFFSSVFAAWHKLNKPAISSKWQEMQDGWMSAPLQICSALLPVRRTNLEKWDKGWTKIDMYFLIEALETHDRKRRCRSWVLFPPLKNIKNQMQGGCLWLQAAHKKKQGVDRLMLSFSWIPVLFFFFSNMILWHILLTYKHS